MAKYRVELREDHAILKNGNPVNPFALRDPFHAARRRARIWEFEAKDEDEVRRLYSEAKARDLANVRGYDLYSITAVHADIVGDGK